MFNSIFYVLILTLILPYGCAHTQLTRYYQKADIEPAENNYIEVALFAKDAPPRSLSLISQLSPQSQEALITEVGKKTSNIQDFSNALNEVGKPQNSQNIIDRTIFHKRVVFSIKNKLPVAPCVSFEKAKFMGPADRISALKITMELDPNKSVFESWDRFDTLEGTINLGDLHRTQKTSAELSGTIGPAAQQRIPASATGKVSTEETIDETLHLMKRRIQLSGEILPEKAVLFQEGGFLTDLTGTFSVDFDIRVKEVGKRTIVKIGSQTQDGQPLAPEMIRVGFARLLYPMNQNKDISCSMNYEYVLRKVGKKAREIAEGYHHAHYLKWDEKQSKPFTLISKEELKNVIFKITDNKGRYLNIANETMLNFLTYEEADNFIILLKSKKMTTVGGYKLRLLRHDLRLTDLPYLGIDFEEL